MMERYGSMARYVMVMVLVVCMNGLAVGQEVRQSLFTEAEEAAFAARKAQADILAPKSFGTAMGYYADADAGFEKGNNIEKIKGKLDDAVKYFNKSVEVATLSNITFPDTIKARIDALKADCLEFSPALWAKGEEIFKKAGVQLEKKGVAAAQKSGEEALALYREAELDAIGNRLLNGVRAHIKAAEEAKALEFAPKTLQSAKYLLQNAEEVLVQDRYDTEPVEDLARMAGYEARHALYLSNQFNKIKSKATTLEDYVLDFEGIMERIAIPADVVAEFDNGVHKTAVEIIEYIEHARNLAAENARLEEMLGNVRTDKLALKEQVETQAIIREKFEQVDTLFTREQAQVFREGNNIYLRMVGLSFDVGQSVLKPQNYGLLTKALGAIKIFPGSRVIVEGHTDSQGSDKLNLKLSRERAEVVREYIVANMDMAPERSSSEGYGKARPIANNETAEGRAMNRRIDIVIIPNLEQMVAPDGP
ncbi:hypothetical protein DSLASN_19410 [Desulfoluna limicola]|uniref:OmpA-like domain-containing protein n=1 Tax=Desulfoluna limicola TaxID=2810562 RepID=A0ABN6F5K3_9BACT|nr:OmpA family protein [Desulfoluna limicola]BCS96309.1 hypothetical protein DSLASN_19410 [Desulfoluna limicola]